MKSRIALLITSLLSASAFASSVEGPYAALNLGFTDYSKSTLPAQFGVAAGYNFAMTPRTSLAVELSASELGDGLYFQGFTAVHYRTYSYNAVIKPKYHFLALGYQPAYIAAVIGVSRVEESREYYVRGEGYRKYRDHDITGVYGLELGREITKNIDVMGYFNFQKADMFDEDNYYRSYGMSIKYRF